MISFVLWIFDFGCEMWDEIWKEKTFMVIGFPSWISVNVGVYRQVFKDVKPSGDLCFGCRNVSEAKQRKIFRWYYRYRWTSEIGCFRKMVNWRISIMIKGTGKKRGWMKELFVFRQCGNWKTEFRLTSTDILKYVNKFYLSIIW